jgi:hypothetical protein
VDHQLELGAWDGMLAYTSLRFIVPEKGRYCNFADSFKTFENRCKSSVEYFLKIEGKKPFMVRSAASRMESHIDQDEHVISSASTANNVRKKHHKSICIHSRVFFVKAKQ